MFAERSPRARGHQRVTEKGPRIVQGQTDLIAGRQRRTRRLSRSKRYHEADEHSNKNESGRTPRGHR
jgi:hypothetical protein